MRTLNIQTIIDDALLVIGIILIMLWQFVQFSFLLGCAMALVIGFAMLMT